MMLAKVNLEIRSNNIEWYLCDERQQISRTLKCFLEQTEEEEEEKKQIQNKSM